VQDTVKAKHLGLGQTCELPVVKLCIVLLTLLQSCLHAPELPYPAEKPSGIYHVVEKNQTLWRICKTYGVDMQYIAEFNNIRDVSQIRPGAKIFIPGAKKNLNIIPTLETEKPEPQQTHVQTDRAPGIFAWPLRGPVIKPFGIVNGLKHGGINIQAQLGSLVCAAAPGKVVFSSMLQGYGNTLIVEHGGRYATVYANNATNLVSSGQWIKRGQPIARTGSASGQGSSYLHFQIRHNNHPRNPLFFLPRLP